MPQPNECDPVLCLVKGEWAYFTTQALRDVWGDDFNDAPYEYNAGLPYRWRADSRTAGAEPWQIVKVAFDADLEQPCDGHHNSPWSVEQINNGAIAWLRSPSWETRKRLAIPAGTPLSVFVIAIEEYGGEVYVRQDGYQKRGDAGKGTPDAAR